MKTIIRKFRKIILRKAIVYCDLRISRLDLKSDRYHEIIIKKIINGEDELVIDKLRFDRDQLHYDNLELIDLRNRFKRQLARV